MLDQQPTSVVAIKETVEVYSSDEPVVKVALKVAPIVVEKRKAPTS